MQAGKNNLEIQLLSLFGRYFSALKLERQLDCVVFQAKAGREESWAWAPSRPGQLPARPCHSPLPWQHKTFLQHLLFVVTQENSY